MTSGALLVSARTLTTSDGTNRTLAAEPTGTLLSMGQWMEPRVTDVKQNSGLA